MATNHSDRVKINVIENRLNHFYGDVAKSQNKDIINFITGRRILDIGCGCGYLIRQIMQEKMDAEVSGIDIDSQAIDAARTLYNIGVKNMSAYKLDFSDDYFDTIILRETVHHFESYDNLKTALNEIRRVCKKELIIFDPNPNWLVKFSRKIIKHVDPEASLSYIAKVLEESGFAVRLVRWRDVIAFPLSGGFVGMEFVPNIKFFKNIVISLDRALNISLCKLNIQKYFCWRYLIYAIKQNVDRKKEEI